MSNPRDTNRFASRLLRQDESLSDSRYQEYRVKLEIALQTAERREKLIGHVVVASCVVSFTLMFVGGSKLLGDFDPWSKNATTTSIATGVVYLLTTVLFFLSLATYYSRLRPAVKDAKERLRDERILDLQRQIEEIRKLLVSNTRHDEPNAE
jgi:hypothetical protein